MKLEIHSFCVVRCSDVAFRHGLCAVRRAQVGRAQDSSAEVRGADFLRHHENPRGGLGGPREDRHAGSGEGGH